MTVELLNRSYGTAQIGRYTLATRERKVIENVDCAEFETLRAEGGVQGVRVRALPETKPVSYETKARR